MRDEIIGLTEHLATKVKLPHSDIWMYAFTDLEGLADEILALWRPDRIVVKDLDSFIHGWNQAMEIVKELEQERRSAEDYDVIVPLLTSDYKVSDSRSAGYGDEWKNPPPEVPDVEWRGGVGSRSAGRMVSDVSDTYNKLSKLDGKKFPAQKSHSVIVRDVSTRYLPVDGASCGLPDCPVCK